MNTLEALEELKIKVAELEAQIKKESEIKPVFPRGRGYVLNSTSLIDSIMNGSRFTPGQGNTFYTKEEAEKEALRRKAETRVRERINIENKGDSGFRVCDRNYTLAYDLCFNSPVYHTWTNVQTGNSWECLHEKRSVKLLLKDKDFIADWKLMKGINNG